MILQKNQLIVVLCVFVSAQKNFFRRCFSTGSDFRAVLGHSEWLGVIFSRSLCSVGSRLLKKASCEYWSSQSLPAGTQRAEAFSGRVTGRWKSLLAFSEHKGPFQLRLNDEHCNERYFSHTSNHWRRGHTWMDSGKLLFSFSERFLLKEEFSPQSWLAFRDLNCNLTVSRFIYLSECASYPESAHRNASPPSLLLLFASEQLAARLM